jgi:hypothetical protein
MASTTSPRNWDSSDPFPGDDESISNSDRGVAYRSVRDVELVRQGCGTEQADAVPMLFGSLFDGLVPDLFCERDGALPTARVSRMRRTRYPDAAPRPSPYPSGAEWVSRVESISDPLTPVFYCGS